MSHVRRTLALVVATALALGSAAAGHARDVKRCGITIRANKTGTLTRNVECGYRCIADKSVRCVYDDAREDFRCPLPDSGCRAETILLERNATLDLDGFDLSAAYQQDTIVCAADGRGKCTIKGPGNFRARKGQAITANDKDVILKELTLTSDYLGLETAGWIRLTNVTLSRCSSDWHAGKGIRAKKVTLGTGCTLATSKNAYLNDVTATDAAVLAEGTVRGANVRAARIVGKDVFLTRSQVPRQLDTELSSYQTSVTAEHRLVLRDSVLGGIASGEAPQLIRSTCMQSERVGAPGSWGVCAID